MTMVDVYSKRFGHASNQEIDDIIRKAKPHITERNRKCVWNQFEQFCKERGYQLARETPTQHIANILKDWGMNMRKSNGDEYKEYTVKTMWNVTAKIIQEKYLQEHERNFNPFSDQEFKCARDARNAKRKQLQKIPEKRKQSKLDRSCNTTMASISSDQGLNCPMVQIKEEYVTNDDPQFNFDFIEVNKIDIKDETESEQDKVREDKNLENQEVCTRENLLEQTMLHEKDDVNNFSIGGDGSTGERNTQSEQSSQATTSAKCSVMQCKKKLDSDVPYINEALSKLDSIQEAATNLKETEFDVWAKSLAIQLNSMEPRRALDLQLKIQTLLSQERLAYEGQKLRPHQPSTSAEFLPLALPQQFIHPPQSQNIFYSQNNERFQIYTANEFSLRGQNENRNGRNFCKIAPK